MSGLHSGQAHCQWQKVTSLETPVQTCNLHGASPIHASSVPLVLNPDSGAITSAFHVVFNDWFATVPLLDDYTFPDDVWHKLFERQGINMFLMMMMMNLILSLYRVTLMLSTNKILSVTPWIKSLLPPPCPSLPHLPHPCCLTPLLMMIYQFSH